MVAKIATGEVVDTVDRPRKSPNRAKGGKTGGKARAKALSAERRKEIAQKAAKSRWDSR
jgi:hypothetical protein